MEEAMERETDPTCKGAVSPESRFSHLLDLIARLRGPDGCPWDRAQTHASLRPYVLEEAYEVADAIDRGDPLALCEELGDLLLQVLLHSQIGKEMGTFDIADCMEGLSRKLIRRHPHVFGEDKIHHAAEVERRWEEIKAAERSDRETGSGPRGWLDEVPSARPAMEVALRLGKRAARVGFDWDGPESVIDKIKEELLEVERAVQMWRAQGVNSAKAVRSLQEEIGDLLFAVVNLARVAQVDPEAALAGTNRKFCRRFEHMEAGLREKGLSLEEASLAEMEALWQSAKHLDG